MNTNHPNSDQPEKDLDWLAFCYVADELDAETRTSFEQRLASDTAACDAVARAIQLSQLVCNATEIDQAPTSDNSRNRVSLSPNRSFKGWRVLNPRIVFAASILLTLLAVGWAVKINLPGGSIAGLPSDDLAQTWADSLTQIEVGQGDEDPGMILFADFDREIGEFESDVEIESDPLSVDKVLDEVDLKDNWMLIALAEMEKINQ